MTTLPSRNGQTALVPRATSLLAPQLDYILIDGSGSMQNLWWDIAAALDTYMATLKASRVPSHVIAAVFDTHDVAQIQRNETVDTWTPLSTQPITANWGLTPLYDAINAMGRHLRDLAPERAAITIATDGDENASRYTDQTQARAILDWCRAHGWQVTFIGCDFNNSAQARALGADDSTAIGVAKALLTDAAKSLAMKRARYSTSGEDITFSDGEKQQFGGYLNAPSR